MSASPTPSGPNPKADSVLLPFLQAQTDVEADRCLERLLEAVVLPKMAAILKRKLGATAFGGPGTPYEGQNQTDCAELQSDIRLQVIRRLQAARTVSTDAPIADLAAYVSTTTFNAVSMYLRKKYPQRYSLENRLRYLLEHRPGLAIWRSAGGTWLAGFAVWRDRTGTPPLTEALRQLRETPERFAQAAFEAINARSEDPGWQVAAILNKIGHPVELDDLVPLFAIVWDMKDVPLQSLPTEETGGVEMDTQDTIMDEVQAKWDAQRLWSALCRLPPRQCAAVLLQARDGEGNSLVELLELAGTASLREMAAAMDLSVETLAALWEGLPMDDAQIAGLLGVSPHHVTRLRMDARRILAKRRQCEDET